MATQTMLHVDWRKEETNTDSHKSPTGSTYFGFSSPSVVCQGIKKRLYLNGARQVYEQFLALRAKATIMLRRSQLFVPSNDEKKIRKSITLKADSIVFDLEDAVPPEDKSNARELLKRLLRELDWGKRELCVRVNPIASLYFKDDIDQLKNEEKIDSIVVPKAEERLDEIRKSTGKSLIPLIETAKGLLNVEEIAKAEGVVAMSFGAADFAHSVGGSVEAYTANLFVKTQIVVAAKAYGIDPIDNVYFKLNDLDGFRAEASQSRHLGYVGKQVVHPTQIEIANEVFSPSAKDIERASRIIDVYERAMREGVGAVRMDEQLVDAVHYRQAKQLLDKKNMIEELAKQIA